MEPQTTDLDIDRLSATAKPLAVVLLQWGAGRTQPGAERIEREHQRRMVTLRNDGVIAVLCPVSSDELCGVAIMDLPPERALDIMKDDPCVAAGMMDVQVEACHGFPGDRIPSSRSLNRAS